MRKYLMPLVAVAVIVNVLGVGLSASAESSYPRIFGKSGFNDGPVRIQQSLTPVGTISVPRGNWVLNAKLYVENIVQQPVRVGCELQAGGDFDFSATTLGNSGGILNTDSLAMQVVHTFTEASNDVVVACGSTGPDRADAYMIKISGIKVGRLSNVGLH